ncbi:hypothetical protein PVK06_018911 [Gossypium arboreum]|uniref:Uncharacterized protein n=1 Tax=Gossypium arboreum TaxID=29729 RepID=A0ABR0PIG1_GOSAR|nr:hypothetical protein PVK06_018911 [Gossypium arboreum]
MGDAEVYILLSFRKLIPIRQVTNGMIPMTTELSWPPAPSDGNRVGWGGAGRIFAPRSLTIASQFLLDS